jgi:hypothetical protein
VPALLQQVIAVKMALSFPAVVSSSFFEMLKLLLAVMLCYAI